jgi:hypothetical protein
LEEAGVRCLIMGGQAVRHYGIDRNTDDFDFQINVANSDEIINRLAESRLFANRRIVPGASWRQADFFRFEIGKLPSGKEEWMEFWIRNHLLSSFEDAFGRREEEKIGNVTLTYMALPDLIRSKETERDQDWLDVNLLEEELDQRNLAKISKVGPIEALANLRTRRGYERAESLGLFKNHDDVKQALRIAQHPATRAFLIPFAREGELAVEPALARAIQSVQPGTSRHIALVHTVRLLYQTAAKAADHEDKKRLRRENH